MRKSIQRIFEENRRSEYATAWDALRSGSDEEREFFSLYDGTAVGIIVKECMEAVHPRNIFYEIVDATERDGLRDIDGNVPKDTEGMSHLYKVVSIVRSDGTVKGNWCVKPLRIFANYSSRAVLACSPSPHSKLHPHTACIRGVKTMNGRCC